MGGGGERRSHVIIMVRSKWYRTQAFGLKEVAVMWGGVSAVAADHDDEGLPLVVLTTAMTYLGICRRFNNEWGHCYFNKSDKGHSSEWSQQSHQGYKPYGVTRRGPGWGNGPHAWNTLKVSSSSTSIDRGRSIEGTSSSSYYHRSSPYLFFVCLFVYGDFGEWVFCRSLLLSLVCATTRRSSSTCCYYR